MAKASEHLLSWVDPQLGELVWDDRDGAWTGRVEFAGRTVPLSIDTGLRDPSPVDQTVVIEPARLKLGKLAAAESQLRRQAADEITEAVVEQQDLTELPVREFADGLELACICLGEDTALHYLSVKFFPGHTVTIYVNPDLTFAGAEVYRPRAPA